MILVGEFWHHADNHPYDSAMLQCFHMYAPNAECRSQISSTPDRWLAATRLQESISIIRDEAYNQRSVDGVLNVFQNRFHVSLHDLRELFANQTWRHARSYGGHAWAGITGLAIALSDAIREERGGEANLLLTKVQNARHNTGSLTEKLAKLRTGAISEGQENICDRLGECGGSAS